MGIDFRPLIVAGFVAGILTGGAIIKVVEYVFAHLTIGWL